MTSLADKAILSGADNRPPMQEKDIEPQIRSPQLVALEYADLSIPHIITEEGAVRVRQHVNPLSSKLSVPVEPPNWNDVFEDPKLPLVVDIGSGNDHILLLIRNLHYPMINMRHHKRRIVQKPLVEAIVDELMPRGQVFIQSDVLEVAVDMRKYFDEESEKLIHVDKIDSSILCDDAGWLLSNPMGIRTEREIHAEYEGMDVDPSGMDNHSGPGRGGDHSQEPKRRQPVIFDFGHLSFLFQEYEQRLRSSS
uniref:tRNA (guanine(46)-N(7))-methyltransferase n=1 Tax=Tanacetum cinerariifolium TaxID=118510 RepID=A0A6L2KP82_TANCI|nr:tRNA (guanine-N(7)-)-methyltransferase [Tanacetum cinerariifolium]